MARTLPADPTELKELRELTRRYVQATILPQIAEDEKSERFRPEWIRALGELGLCGVSIPEELGGAGLGYQHQAVVIEELARGSSAYAISVGVSGLPQTILNQWGTEAQKQRYIPGLARGEVIGAFSLSEAGAGSDAASLTCVAKRVPGGYRLTGSKLWCTQADSAGVILVMARTGEPGAKGVSAFILENGTEGFILGKREHKMGLHASHTMEYRLEDAFIPEDRRVGEEGQGLKVALSALDPGRINIGAVALGIAQASLELATEHARTRKQFGRAIGEFQGVSFLLADAATQLHAARLLVQDAAFRKDAGLPVSQASSMAKLFATDMAMRVTTDCVQVLGGAGYTQEYPLERYMREAKVLQIVEGTNQIQRLVIGRKLLEGDWL